MADGISRRQLLAVASSSLVTLGSASRPGSATQGTERILQESFENAPEKTRPSGWTKSGSGVATVVVPDGGESVTGSKIFGMGGDEDSCSSVGASHAIDIEGRTWARFKAYVFPTDRGNDGCTPRRAGVSLHAGGSESVSLVELMTDGTVRGPGSEPLGEYTERAWNELVVEYDRSGERVELSYIINSDSRGTISKPRHSVESDLSRLQLNTGVDIVWWDALEVTASAKTPTPTSAPEESVAGRGEGADSGSDGLAGGSDTNPSGDALWSVDGAPIPGLGLFGWFVGAAGTIVVLIFSLVASAAASETSGGSNTGSSRRLSEDEVRDGLEDAEESLRDRQ